MPLRKTPAAVALVADIADGLEVLKEHVVMVREIIELIETGGKDGGMSNCSSDFAKWCSNALRTCGWVGLAGVTD